MKRTIFCCVVALILALCLAVPAMADSIVAQGKCITYDKDKHVVTIEDYDTDFTPEHKYGKPTGKQSTYDTTGTLIGVVPAPGDVLRIAYEAKGDQRHAIRIMNVTKQDLMKK
jgi:hypothetical protein